MSMFTRIRPIAMLVALTLVSVPALAGYAEGMECFKSKNWECTIAQFAPEVEAHPEYDFGWFMIGVSHLQKKDYGQAIENLNKAIEISGDKLSYHLNKAKAYLDQKQYGMVIEILADKQSLSEDAAEAYNLNYQLGTAYHKEKQHGKAAPYLEKAVVVKPDFVTYYMLGASYEALNQVQKSIGALKDALRQKPGDAEVEAMLGSIYLGMAQREANKPKKEQFYTEAVSHATTAARKKPSDYKKQNILARAYLGADQYPEAERAFKAVLRLKPNYCFAQINLGKVYIAMKRWHEAVKILNDGTKCAPGNAVGWESRGFAQEKIYKELNTEQQKIAQLEKSLSSFRKAAAIKSTSSIQSSLDRVQNNIDIEKQNIRIAQANIRTMENNLKALRDNKTENQKTLDTLTKQRQFFLDKGPWPDEKEQDYATQKAGLGKAMADLDQKIQQQEKELDEAKAAANSS